MFWLTEVSTAHKVMHAYTYAQRSLFSLASFMRVQANMRSRWVLIFMHVCLSASVVCFKLYDTNRHRHWFCCLFVFSLMGCAKWRRCQLVIVQDWLSKVRVPALHITKLSKEQHWKRTSMKVFSCICFCVPLWSPICQQSGERARRSMQFVINMTNVTSVFRVTVKKKIDYNREKVKLHAVAEG